MTFQIRHLRFVHGVGEVPHRGVVLDLRNGVELGADVPRIPSGLLRLAGLPERAASTVLAR